MHIKQIYITFSNYQLWIHTCISNSNPTIQDSFWFSPFQICSSHLQYHPQDISLISNPLGHLPSTLGVFLSSHLALTPCSKLPSLLPPPPHGCPSHLVCVVLQGQWCFKDKGQPCLKKFRRYTPYRTLITLPATLRCVHRNSWAYLGDGTCSSLVPNKEKYLSCPTPTL